jgi:mRNA interferase RelE/StbE
VKYSILIKKSAAKELEDLPSNILRKVTFAITELSIHPRPTGVKKLKGELGDLWRIRIGDYRVIYSIEDVVRIIEIKKVGHRKDVYD